MFLNRWTVELAIPGQIIENGFDSKEEALMFAERMQEKASDGSVHQVKITDPQGRTACVKQSKRLVEESRRKAS